MEKVFKFWHALSVLYTLIQEHATHEVIDWLIFGTIDIP